MRFRLYHLLNAGILACALWALPCVAAETKPAPLMPLPASTPAASPAMSADAEGIFADAKQRILQIRTLVTNTGQQYILGSGFYVSDDGYIITNYHVVSEYALEPSTYNLQYLAPDGAQGPLQLIAIDIVNDLALVRADRQKQPFFEFDPAASELKGKRLFALGNPLDLGFTIVEGTYNGLIDHSPNDRIHFTGAINAGMSGGPTVTSANKVVGINVAKSVGNELISFLVPARFAIALLDRARKEKPIALPDVRKEISRELGEWQDHIYKTLLERTPETSDYGPFKVYNDKSSWFDCWSNTNANDAPPPLASLNSTACTMDASLFFENELRTGTISYAHSYIRTDQLNAFRFSKFVEKQDYFYSLRDTKGQYYTKRKCYQNFVAMNDDPHRPPMQVIWCAQAYRDFDELYDVTVVAAAQSGNNEALVSRILMKGVSYKNATALTAKFLGTTQWKP